MEKVQKAAIFAALILGITIGAGIALQDGIYQLHSLNPAVQLRLNKFTGDVAACNPTRCYPLGMFPGREGPPAGFVPIPNQQ